MASKSRFLALLIIVLTLSLIPACSGKQPPTATASPTPALAPTMAPALPAPTSAPTAVPTTTSPEPTPIPPSPTAPPPPPGPAVWNVQFALDVETNGDLVFPATQFVYGVTRVYVRFSYQGLGGVHSVETNWYLNDNLVSPGQMAWDGGDSGDYIIWAEDPTGLGRGQWRWELVANDAVLGGGVFTIGGEPRYAKPAWGITFDPPLNWQIESEQENFVTFSNPDGQQGMALLVGPGDIALEQVAADVVAIFQTDHPDAALIETRETTMNGQAAVLQKVRYTDAENGEQYLAIVSALHGERAYTLWVLGPAQEATALQETLVAALFSMRFLPGE